MRERNPDWSNSLLNIHDVDGAYTVLQSDSGRVFMIDDNAGTSAYRITLPTTLVEGWNCTVILQSDSGFGGDGIMDYKVNIDLGADTNNVGIIHGGDAGGSDQAVDGDDFINCTNAASPGDTFHFLSDGTRWFITGLTIDSSECPFGTATA